ncbi:MAG TPA: alpha/beta hydrolase, partial [Chroococcales cyanobacterium]
MTYDAGNQAKQLGTPAMMLTAGHDKIVDTTVCEKVYAQIRSEKRTRHFQDAWHDLMFDPVIDQVVDESLRWIAETASIPGEKLLLV